MRSKPYEGTNKFPVESPEGVVDKFGQRITIWVSPGQRINWTKELRRIRERENEGGDNELDKTWREN